MRYFLILFLLLPLTATAANLVNLDPLPVTESLSIQAADRIGLGADTRRGVRAEAYLLPLVADPSAGGEAGPNYLLQVDFFRLDQREKILEGQAAARVFDARNDVRSTVRLAVEQDRWSCALRLPPKGETMIKVGSQLPDGKKRIYRFFFTPEGGADDKEAVPPAG